MIHPAYFRPDLHEAKDIRSLLDRLPAHERVRWLRLCCLKISSPGSRLDVVSSDGSTRSVLADFYSICGQSGLTLEWATGLAEFIVDKRDIREQMAKG